MLSDYFSEINDHGTVVPVKDLAAFPRSEQAVLGATNLLENKFTSAEVAGIATTKDNDGVMTLAGGTTTGNYYAIIQGGFASSHIAIPSWLKKGETYYISDGQEKTDMWVGIWFYDSNDQPLFSDAKRNEAFTVPNAAAYYLIALYTATGKTITNGTKFYPMISVGATKPSVFAPYAMTNRELTDAVEDAKDIKYTSDGTTYTRLKQYVVKPTMTFSSGVGTATLYKPTGETIGSFAVACANSDKAVAHVNVSGTTATVTLTDTSYSSTAPVTIVYFTYKA